MIYIYMCVYGCTYTYMITDISMYNNCYSHGVQRRIFPFLKFNCKREGLYIILPHALSPMRALIQNVLCLEVRARMLRIPKEITGRQSVLTWSYTLCSIHRVCTYKIIRLLIFVSICKFAIFLNTLCFTFFLLITCIYRFSERG